MNTIRVSAPSAEQAVDLALKQLQIPRDALQYRVDHSEEEYLLDDRRSAREVSVIAWIRPEYLASLAREMLQKLIHMMGFLSEIRTEITDERIIVRLGSPNSNVLIGKNGSTLDAIQYLIMRMVGRGGRVLPPIIIDVESYKERKIMRLERIAKRTAQKVADEGHEIVLQPMAAGDRKIIHTALKNFRGIKTFSQGPEGDRCVVIAPATESEGFEAT
jgi:spoIIIJ-associated protein